MRKTICAAFFGFVVSVSMATPVNVARGKKVTFNIPPNYWLCADAGDADQLTDGKTTEGFNGYAWTDKAGCVGWGMLDKLGLVQVTVDLGEDTPICGFSWNLAFGTSCVTFPDMIDVYVSVDGRTWHLAGPLLSKSLALRPMPPPTRYAHYRVHHEDMPCHGRYVAFLVEQKPFCFVDEIEVYRGDESLLKKPNPGVAISEPIRFQRTGKLRSQLETEADRAQASQAVRELVGKVDFDEVKDARMELPWPPVRRAIWAENAKRLRAAGLRRPSFWTNNRWENLDPLSVPTKDALAVKPIVLDMMRGEVRAETVNILNPTDDELDCTFHVEGLSTDSAIVCQEVVYTDTKDFRSVSGALRSENDATVSFRIPAGASKQVWISANRPQGVAGVRRGRVVAKISDGTVLSCEFHLRIRDLDFPRRPGMHLGGWDYLDRMGDYYQTPKAFDATRRFHRELGLDIAWGSTLVRPSGAVFDASGAMTGSPDFTAWDRWTLEICPYARVYAVFMDVGRDFCGEPAGTPRFDRMIGDYLRAWVEHARANGLGDRRIVLLLADEPYEMSLVDLMLKWMRPIRALGLRELKVFEDVHFQKPWNVPEEFWDLCDIVSPQTDHVRDPKRFAFYQSLVARGKNELWLYSANGPSRTFDPISYYRMQAWTAFALGAKESATQFWAFGCGGGIGDSWTPHRQTSVEYSPYFVSPECPMDAKQCEGAREGVEDFEYLAMYADRFGREKLEKVLSHVHREMPYGDPDWDASGRNHALLDDLRVKILDRLEVGASDPAWMDKMPHPIFDERPQLVDLYQNAWKLAHDHIASLPGIPAPRYMDEALWDDRVWIWDTCFMAQYCKYHPREFPGIESLENFYCVMLADKATSLPRVTCKFASTGKAGDALDFLIHHPDNPPLFAWTEYKYALQTGDRRRLEKVYGEKKWLQRWYELFESFDPANPQPHGSACPVSLKKAADGFYWQGCPNGMDNTPRGRADGTDPRTCACPNNPDLLWVDALAQQGLAALCLSRIAKVLERGDEVRYWRDRYETIRRKVNELYWDDVDGFYYDISAKDRTKVRVMTPASFWPALAEMPSHAMMRRMSERLRDPLTLGGEVPTPSLARNDEAFDPKGGYWRGAIWLPTSYMTVKALDVYGEYALARDVARKVVERMYRTYVGFEPRTIWECYSPTEDKPATDKFGGLSRPDFCGWSALGPISLFIEDVIGIKEANAFANRLVCDFPRNPKGRVGVENYRFGEIVCSVVVTESEIVVDASAPFELLADGRILRVRKGHNKWMRALESKD